MEKTILAIETSCDETGLAVLRQTNDQIKVLSSALASQIDIHKATGGVVPEVAAREHTQVIRPLLRKVLREANIDPAQLGAIAVTIGPGLQPALAVGVAAARALAYAWRKPIIPVHHLEGHIYSALLPSPQARGGDGGGVKFPLLALIVSGGHTMLVKMTDHVNYQIIGTTQDDAAGEAFDKVARLLGLPYPGGPHLSKLADRGDSQAFDFPRPMLNSGDHNFSFSGLKTAVLYKLRKLDLLDTSADRPGEVANIAASFQAAVVDTLVTKTSTAAEQENIETVLLVGGVAANQKLRQELSRQLAAQNITLRVAPLELCGDNAIMIGQAAFFSHRQTTWKNIDAHARLELSLFSRGGGQLGRK